jgi:ribosomal protein L4
VASDLINTYDILNSNQLLMTLDAVKSIEEIWDVNNKLQGSNDES